MSLTTHCKYEFVTAISDRKTSDDLLPQPLNKDKPGKKLKLRKIILILFFI